MISEMDLLWWPTSPDAIKEELQARAQRFIAEQEREIERLSALMKPPDWIYPSLPLCVCCCHDDEPDVPYHQTGPIGFLAREQ